jgi:hypothetical protein
MITYKISTAYNTTVIEYYTSNNYMFGWQNVSIKTPTKEVHRIATIEVNHLNKINFEQHLIENEPFAMSKEQLENYFSKSTQGKA